MTKGMEMLPLKGCGHECGNGMRPVHPGEVLREELDELGLSANALARALGVPTNRVTAILNGQRGVSADTALRLARYFGTTPQLWMNLQKTWELRQAEIESGREIAACVTPPAIGCVAYMRPVGSVSRPGRETVSRPFRWSGRSSWRWA